MKRRKFAFRFLLGLVGSASTSRIFSGKKSNRVSSGKKHIVTFSTPLEVFHNKEDIWENNDIYRKITDKYIAQGDILNEEFSENKDHAKLTLQFKSELAYWRWEKDLSVYGVYNYRKGAEKVNRKFES